MTPDEPDSWAKIVGSAIGALIGVLLIIFVAAGVLILGGWAIAKLVMWLW